MKTRFVVLALAIPMALGAQQPQSMDPAAGPVTNSFRASVASFYRNIPQAFDSIPADKFGYKPTPAQLTFGYVAQHLANDNYFFCQRMTGKTATRPADETSTPDSVKATWPKDKLVAQLKASYAFCQDAMTGLNDAKLLEEIDVPGPNNTTRKVARVSAAFGHVRDQADHYSQIANYMRLNGMLPPSALPRPQRGSN
jgi:hypothetical protein